MLVGRKRKRGRRKNTEKYEDEQLMGRGLHKKTIDLLNYVNENILLSESKSIRRIYYALEAQGIIVGSNKSYAFVKQAIKQGRFHGLIDPDKLLVDRKRQTRTGVRSTYHAHTIIDRLSWSAYNYKINFWDFSDHYIEVWQEKGTVEPEFHKICSEYNVRLETAGGDQSIQVVWNAMKRWNLFLSRVEKITVLYYGDFNPSGLHAVKAIENTISKLSESWKDKFSFDFSQVEFKRIGLNLEHIKKYKLPENPTKQTSHKDKVIAEKFIRKFGDINVEMDSLAEKNPSEFLNMISKGILEYIDKDLIEKAKEKRSKVVPRLEKIINTMKKDYFEKEEI